MTGTGQPSHGLQIIRQISTLGGGGQRSFPQQPKSPASAWLEPKTTTTTIAATIENVVHGFTLKLLRVIERIETSFNSTNDKNRKRVFKVFFQKPHYLLGAYVLW